MDSNFEPRIEKRKFLLVGINKFAKWDDDFGALVKLTEEELEGRVHEIKNIIDPKIKIKYFYSETGTEDGFNYLQCVEVRDASNIPQGFTYKTLEMSDYAVFVEKNGEEGTVIQYARNNWLPNSNYEENFAIRGDLEISNTSNNINHENWLPIIKK